MQETRKANRLITAASPYLRQHAFNPVDWYEWSDEALEKAKKENKPVLVSIGYSSCHWCHVMEREVFEKDDIARVMNEHLVCIKVDREERPDIDLIYMEAVQAMGIQGGWPLNVFLTPDQKPFYGGTYFPPDQWMTVVKGIYRGYTERRSDVDASANELASHLASQDTSHLKKVYEFTNLTADLDKMFAKLSPAFDTKWGGLDKAPKFIMPSVWLWMLRYHHLTGNREALDHILLTLRRIAWGGIYDQLGGGFARYSVDAYWFVPHFEKMLYDNAQLISLYSEAFSVTREHLFRDVVFETFEWLQSEMMHPGGGFFSALDADSEGTEGLFYTWTAPEIEKLLGDEAALFMDFFNIKKDGNWEHGRNVLIRTVGEDEFVAKHGLNLHAWQDRLRKGKDKLLAARDSRIRPGLDDKIIASWNAMTITALVDAYRYLGDDRFLQSAIKAIRFMEKELINGQVIFRSFRERRSETQGFLDDYAFVTQAYTRLYQATFDEEWIRKAKRSMEYTLENFHDKDDGFFYYTSSQGEKLIARKKELFDNVIPASNSVMVRNLFELGTLLDKEEWKRLAEAIVTPLSHLIVGEPNYMSNWAIGYTEIKSGFAEVVFAGDENLQLYKSLFESYQPLIVTLAAREGTELALADGKTAADGKPTIYVCCNKTCARPVHDANSANEQIVGMRPHAE